MPASRPAAEEVRSAPPPLLPGNSKRHYLAAGLLLASIILAYANSLHGTWAMDDVMARRPLGMQDIRTLAGYRGVAYLTFLVNGQIAPVTPFNFRVFNIGLHFLNALLVYVLAYKTLRMYHADAAAHRQWAGNDNSADRRAFAVALAAAALFALHPLNINAVAYIIQRMALLATFFVLLSLLSYIAAARSSNPAQAVFYYVVSTVSIVLGIFSKENAVMAVPLILLYDFFFISRLDPRPFAKKLAVVSGMGLASIVVGSYFLNPYSQLGELAGVLADFNQPLARKGWTAIDVHWTPLQHVLTEFRVVTRYLLLLIVPLPRFLIFDWWGYPISRGIADPMTTLYAALFIVSLLTVAVVKRRSLPLLAFGILWYLIAISLESFLTVGADLYFEHRNYLPLAGLAVGIAGQVAVVSRMRERVFMAGALLLCLLLGTMTFARNAVWKDSVTLWEDTLLKSPSNLRAMMSLGNAYYGGYDFSNAERYYKKALNISSRDRRPQFFSDSAYTLAMMYLFEGKLQPAKQIIDGLGDVIESARPRILMGFYKALNQDPAGALPEYAAALQTAEGLDAVITLTLQGNALRDLGRFEQAIGQYRLALGRDASFAEAYYGIGASYLGMKNIPLAREYLEKTLALDPANVLALSDKADLALAQKGNTADALAYAERAVAKDTHLYQPYLTMATVLIVAGRDEEAAVYFKKATSKGMPDYMAPFGKARAYYMKGDHEKVNQYLAEVRRYDNLPERIRSLVRR